MTTATGESTTPRSEPAITVDAAFRRRLACGEEPHVAVEGLNAAILAQKILLFVGGRKEPVEPRWFANHARVAIELVEGRATAVVICSGRGFEDGPYSWTVSGDGMESDAEVVQVEIVEPWPTISGDVNWTTSAILAPAAPSENPAPKLEARRKPGTKPRHPL
jgi:hypothetical protein